MLLGRQWLLVLVSVISCGHVVSSEKRHWKYDRQPKVSHKKLSLNQLSTENRQVRSIIVDIHNYFRSRVEPSAGNMLQMEWDWGAAKDAQRWARQCQVLRHDNVTGRWVERFGSCGQNIFIATHMVPWLFAIKTWWLEKNLFKYGVNASNDLEEVGHYTQLVWAATHKVGCGIEKCQMNVSNGGNSKKKTYYTYICNYCPIGNFPDRLGTPYQAGKPCSFCKKDCRVADSLRNLKKSSPASQDSGRKTKYSRKLGHFRIKKQRTTLGRRKAKHRKLAKRRKHSKEGTVLESKTIREKKQKGSEVKLCTNSCPVSDLWINCQDLAESWRDWLCHQRNNPEGRKRFRNCRATCICHGKIKN